MSELLPGTYVRREGEEPGTVEGYECSRDGCDELIEPGEDVIRCDYGRVTEKSVTIQNFGGIYHPSCFEQAVKNV